MVKHHVTIHYGPYVSCSRLAHRRDRLEGMQAVLESDGHTVKLHEIEDRNVVELVVHEEVIFKCTIQDLVFGGDGKLDPLCAKALDAVQKAY